MATVEQVSIKLPPEVRKMLKEVAEKRETSMVQTIRDAVEAFEKCKWS